MRQRFLFARCLELRLLRVPGAAIFVFAVAGLRPHVVGMLSTSCGSSGSVVLIWAARVATRGKRVSERSNRASHGPRPHRAAERPSLSSSSLLLQSLLWASKAAALRLAERCPATWASPPALPAAARAMSGCSAARWERSSVLQHDLVVWVLRGTMPVLGYILSICSSARGGDGLFPRSRVRTRERIRPPCELLSFSHDTAQRSRSGCCSGRLSSGGLTGGRSALAARGRCCLFCCSPG